MPSSLVLSALVRLLLKNIRNSALLYAVLAIILYALLYDDYNLRILNSWLTSVLIIHVISYGYSRWNLRSEVLHAPNKIIGVLALLTILQSAVWSSSVWFAINGPDQVQNILVITIVAALISVVMLSLSPVWPLSILYGTTCIAIGALKFSQTGDNYPIISLAGIPYVIVLTFFSRNSCTSIRNAIELHFRNQSLVEQLQIESNEAMLAKQQAQDANLIKSKFLASASHDLRQPLYALGLLLESLSRTQPTSKQALLIDKSLAAATDMANMLHAILDISRIEAGVIAPHKVVFPIQPLLRKLEVALGPEADAKAVAYRSREMNCNVWTDPVFFEQILRNVISNAINYTEDGGVLIGCRRRGQELQIEVWDTGIGIAENKLEYIFQEFNQVGNSERDRHKGFGLGLSIVKGLANTLGHSYRLQSVLGKGSCFKISVPISTETVHGASDKLDPIQPERMDMVVLVIDDDAVVRESIDILLTSWGCRCLAAENADAAVVLAQRLRPDLIISDYRLRDNKTGEQAIRQVHDALGEVIPALIVTGDTSPLRLNELMATGIPVLHKPISAQQLYSMMAAMHNASLLGA